MKRLCLALGLALVGCGGTPRDVIDDAQTPLQTPPDADPKTPQDTAKYLGLVVPRRSLELESSTPGTIAELRVRLGDRIEAGEPVAVLDNAELRQALRAARAATGGARADLTRANHERVVAHWRAEQAERLTGIISEDERTARQHDVRLSSADAVAARSNVKGRNAEVGRLDVQLEALTITSPFSGEVAAVYHGVGQHVPAHGPVARIVSDELVVRFAVDAADIARFDLGTRVQLLRPDEASIGGQVVAIAPEVDAAGLVLVEAELDLNRPGPKVRAGVRGLVRAIFDSTKREAEMPRTHN